MNSIIQPDYRLFVKNNSNYNTSEFLHQILNDPSICQKLLNNNNNLVIINDYNKKTSACATSIDRIKITIYYIKIKKPKHTHSDTSMCSSANDEKN